MSSNPTCWVCPESFNYGYQVNEHAVSVHGVEALTVMVGEWLICQTDLLETVDRLEATEARLAEALAALEWYADREHWEDGEEFEDEDGILTRVWSDARCDAGRTARKVLAGQPARQGEGE